jgi:hypothetical protein
MTRPRDISYPQPGSKYNLVSDRGIFDTAWLPPPAASVSIVIARAIDLAFDCAGLPETARPLRDYTQPALP